MLWQGNIYDDSNHIFPSIYNSPMNLTEMENEIDRNMLATELTGWIKHENHKEF